jgi:hypothetical protein
VVSVCRGHAIGIVRRVVRVVVGAGSWALAVALIVLMVRSGLWLVLAVTVTFAVGVGVLEERDRRAARRYVRREGDDD